MKLFGKKNKVAESFEETTEGDIEYNYEVVGESFGRDHLVQIIRSNNAQEIGEIFTTAILELEPTNAFDPTAVQVLISELHVGYIPKHESGIVTEMISNSGSNRMECPAHIGWDTDNPQPLIGVRIQLDF